MVADALRIVMMLVISELALSVVLGGSERKYFPQAFSLVLFFGTLPLIAITAMLHEFDRQMGFGGTVGIALIGVLPLFFFTIVAPGRGIKVRLDSYTRNSSIAGILWSGAWIVTSFLK